MAVYYCNECDRYLDDDYHPCAEDPRKKLHLLCPECEILVDGMIEDGHAAIREEDRKREEDRGDE